jgi:hypothetical protein
MAAITPKVEGASWRGAPVLDDTPAEVALAFSAYMVATAVREAAHGRYRQANAEAIADRNRSPWYDQGTASLDALANVAYAHWQDAERRVRDAWLRLAEVIVGPRRYYLIQGHLVGFNKLPGQGKCGLQLDVWPPDEVDKEIRRREAYLARRRAV